MAQSQIARVVGLGRNDPLFARVRAEAEEAALHEPELAALFYTTILNQETLEGAVVHRIAARLENADLPSALIRQTYAEFVERDATLGDAFRADILAVADRDPACSRLMEPLLYFKGFHALQTHRLAHAYLLRVCIPPAPLAWRTTRARVQPGKMVVANKRSRKQFRPNERPRHANTTWRDAVAVSLTELLLYWLLILIEDILARAND